jgi:hypothetical protein
MQTVISQALTAERHSLSNLLSLKLDAATTTLLAHLLVLSIYTLRYLRDPQLQRFMHRWQNRIDSYHQLRSAIAQVGGKKELTGGTEQPVRQVDRQRDRLLQLRDPVAPADHVQGQLEVAAPRPARKRHEPAHFGGLVERKKLVAERLHPPDQRRLLAMP